jgi:hypothetical protein
MAHTRITCADCGETLDIVNGDSSAGPAGTDAYYAVRPCTCQAPTIAEADPDFPLDVAHGDGLSELRLNLAHGYDCVISFSRGHTDAHANRIAHLLRYHADAAYLRKRDTSTQASYRPTIEPIVTLHDPTVSCPHCGTATPINDVTEVEEPDDRCVGLYRCVECDCQFLVDWSRA